MIHRLSIDVSGKDSVPDHGRQCMHFLCGCEKNTKGFFRMATKTAGSQLFCDNGEIQLLPRRVAIQNFNFWYICTVTVAIQKFHFWYICAAFLPLFSGLLLTGLQLRS